MKKIIGRSIVGSLRGDGDREENDFYPSPSHTIDDLLKFENFDGVIREPACGDGAMSRRLEELGKGVVSTDLFDRGYGIGGIDFLTAPNDNFDYKDIITNPPYKHGQEFVEKAMEIVKNNNGKVAMLLKLTFLESTGRYKMFKTYPLKRVLVYSKRVSMYKKGEVNNRGGFVAYAWFIRDWTYTGSPTIDRII